MLCSMGLWMNLVGYSSAFLILEANDAAFVDATMIRSTLYIECVACGLVVAALGNRVLILYKRFAANRQQQNKRSDSLRGRFAC